MMAAWQPTVFSLDGPKVPKPPVKNLAQTIDSMSFVEIRVIQSTNKYPLLHIPTLLRVFFEILVQKGGEGVRGGWPWANPWMARELPQLDAYFRPSGTSGKSPELFVGFQVPSLFGGRDYLFLSLMGLSTLACLFVGLFACLLA